MSSKVLGRLDGIRDFDVLVVDVQARITVSVMTRVRNIRGCCAGLPAEDQHDQVLSADLMRSDGRDHSKAVLYAATVDLAILC